MTEPSSPMEPPQRLDNPEIQKNHLYAVLTYRGELATWNWAFFVPNGAVTPIGTSGMLFQVSESPGGWIQAGEAIDVISSPLVVALIQLADVNFLGGYEDIIGDHGLVPIFREVAIPSSQTSLHPMEFSSRTWFLDAIGMLHDCAVVSCDDVWLLEREIRRNGFTAMDQYLGNKGFTVYKATHCS